MKTWNFGIIGAGMIAGFHAKSIAHLENARLVGCCAKNIGNAKKLAVEYNCTAFTDYKELIRSDEIDIILIATPSGFHMEPALEAARYGKHVLCEKPMEITLERVDKMIEAHEKSGTYLGGVFNYRYNDALAPLKKAIDTNRFGNITYASVHVPWWRPDKYYENNWRGTRELDGGGALMNQSIHMVDLIQYLMGPVESLQAFTATLGHQIEVEDTAVSILKFKNNALGYIYGTTASYPGQFRRLEITGTKGTIIQVEDSFKVWDFIDNTEEDKKILKQFGEIKGGGGVSDPAAIPFENHALNIKAFIDAIESGQKFAIDGKEARKAVEIVLAIYRSAEEKRIIYPG